MKNKITWIIHAVTDAYEKNPLLKGMINMHTHGLEDLGLTELSVIVIPETYEIKAIGNLINDIGKMMAEGDVFESGFNQLHYIYNEDGEEEVKFKLIETTCYGEKSLRIILPDLNGKFFDELEDFSEALNPPSMALQHTNLFELEEK